VAFQVSAPSAAAGFGLNRSARARIPPSPLAKPQMAERFIEPPRKHIPSRNEQIPWEGPLIESGVARILLFDAIFVKVDAEVSQEIYDPGSVRPCITTWLRRRVSSSCRVTDAFNSLAIQ
jgi:hypothetical protein